MHVSKDKMASTTLSTTDPDLLTQVLTPFLVSLMVFESQSILEHEAAIQFDKLNMMDTQPFSVFHTI